LSYCSTVNREQERYSKERGRDDMTMTGKKMATVWMAVAMAIAFLLISGAKTVYAITQIDSGPINSTCIWDYWQESDGTDVLSIVSTDNDGGRMDDYTYAPPYDSTAPWAKYRDQIDEIRFQDIVEVGNHVRCDVVDIGLDLENIFDHEEGLQHIDGEDIRFLIWEKMVYPFFNTMMSRNS